VIEQLASSYDASSSSGVLEVYSREGRWLIWSTGSLWDLNSWLEHGLEEIGHSGLLVNESLVVEFHRFIVWGFKISVGGGPGGVGVVLSLQLEEVHGRSGGADIHTDSGGSWCCCSSGLWPPHYLSWGCGVTIFLWREVSEW
jgi:hypothetical protein